MNPRRRLGLSAALSAFALTVTAVAGRASAQDLEGVDADALVAIPLEADAVPDPRTPRAQRLLDAEVNERLRVVRISDADPAVLRYLAERGIRLDARASLLETRSFAGDVVVSIDDGDPMTIGVVAADAVWVAPLPPTE